MQSIFNLDSPILRFLARVFDFILLNLLTLLLCVPLVTAGAAVTALYRVILAWLDHSDESLSPRRLLREWGQSLKTATLPWLGFVAVAFLLLLDIRIIGYMPEAVRIPMVAGTFLIGSIVLLTGLFYFPQLARAPGSPFRPLLSRSVKLAIGLLPRMVIIALLWLLPAALLIFLPRIFIALSFLWVGGWLSLCALTAGKLLLPYLEAPET